MMYGSPSAGTKPFFEARENPPEHYLIAHSDGGARGNPGPAGYGVVVQDESGRKHGIPRANRDSRASGPKRPRTRDDSGQEADFGDSPRRPGRGHALLARVGARQSAARDDNAERDQQSHLHRGHAVGNSSAVPSTSLRPGSGGKRPA